MRDVVTGKQQISAATLAAATALTVPAGTRSALVQCEAAPVRYQLDGSSPTASVGMRLLQTDPPREITIAMGLNSAKFILESGSPLLNVTYLGQAD